MEHQLEIRFQLFLQLAKQNQKVICQEKKAYSQRTYLQLLSLVENYFVCRKIQDWACVFLSNTYFQIFSLSWNLNKNTDKIYDTRVADITMESITSTSHTAKTARLELIL